MCKKYIDQPVYVVAGADNSQDICTKILLAFVIFILVRSEKNVMLCPGMVLGLK